MAGLRLQNFTLPPNVLRLFEILLSLVALCLVSSWDSHGVTYHDLSKDDYNVLSNINFFMAAFVITLLCISFIALHVLLSIRRMSPLLDFFINLVLSMLAFIAAIVMCVSITKLNQSEAVKEADLSFSNFEVAVAFSFMCAFALGGSGYFAFNRHRKQGDLPLNQSHMNADLPGDIPT